MYGNAKAFFLHQHARPAVGKGVQRAAGRVQAGWPLRARIAAAPAMFAAVAARNCQALCDFTQDSVDLGDRTPAYDGEPAVQLPGQPRQQRLQRRVGHHGVGPVDDIQQCAVQIEEQTGALEQIFRGKR